MKYHEASAITGDIESLHQMRVAVRRLRATVRLFAAAIHGSRLRVYERDLPWLGHAAGAVRECDAIEALLRDRGARLDMALADALAPVVAAIAAERDAAHLRFVAELRSRRYVTMCERLANPLLRRNLSVTAAACHAPAMIAPLARTVRKAGKGLGRDAPPAELHRLRVRIKRLRYALEMLAEIGGKRSRKALARLLEMQDLLGLHQDAVATMAWMRTYAATVDAGATTPETLMAVGAILQALTVRRRKLASRSVRQWRKIVRSGLIDDMLDELARAAKVRSESAAQAEHVPLARNDSTVTGDAAAVVASTVASTVEPPPLAQVPTPGDGGPQPPSETPVPDPPVPDAAAPAEPTGTPPPTTPTPTNG